MWLSLNQGRLKPGRMLLVDTKDKLFKADQALKDEIAALYPVSKWLEEQVGYKNTLLVLAFYFALNYLKSIINGSYIQIAVAYRLRKRSSLLI